MDNRQLFRQLLAPTSEEPLALPIIKASGCTLYDDSGHTYIDLIGGISVCNIGHCHPQVVKAIKEQSEKYLHIMVYGELIQSPQLRYAQLLTEHLPKKLNSVYFTNSGAEAVEGAMKLAKRLTGKFEIVACRNSYHGSTQGALSILGDEYWRNAYRPLLPGIRHIHFNNFEDLQFITEQTACIIIEPIQAEAGVIAANEEWMHAVQDRCLETGTLLILDEIQTGFGRTGRLWSFEHYGVTPDVLLLGKAIGGGLPLGAFISSKENMHSLAHNPVLGHITTFGGHPVSCAAGEAAMNVLLNEKILDTVAEKEKLFHQLLHHKNIKSIRSQGLLLAIELENFDKVKSVIHEGLTTNDSNRIFTDWFLFAPNCIRIAPPLTISNDEIKEACNVLQAYL